MFAQMRQSDPSPNSNGCGRLSYKFQRLREQIRASVLKGEFSHRLPGERELGRRYNANAKTINKALSDLSSEGLLVRRVGCGTFVAAAGNGGVAQVRRGTVVCFAQEGGAAEQGYRRAVLEALLASLRDDDHGVRLVAGSSDGNGRGICISEWPASVRGVTDALVFYPLEPLSGGPACLDAEIMAEAYRRHIPMLAVGGFGAEARINAVVPDYVDAGFRLAEYLIRIGCGTLVAVRPEAESREIELVMDGCRMAAVRYRRTVDCVSVLKDACGEESARRLLGSLVDRESVLGQRPEGGAGLICVGRRSLAVVRDCSEIDQRIQAGQAALSAMLEPAESAANDTNITTYEVEAAEMARWAGKLIRDARVGDKPTETSIRGSLKIRRHPWLAAPFEPQGMP